MHCVSVKNWTEDEPHCAPVPEPHEQAHVGAAATRSALPS
jgi:hypothetical protein